MNDYLAKKAALVRKWCLVSTTEAASGHPTSCMSAADLMTVLFDRFYRYDTNNPSNPNNDRLIFSKGHAAPLLYSLYAVSGALPFNELKTLRKFGSRLEGHPTPNFPYTEAATGSLGQGLSIGAGFAYGAKKDRLQFKTYVLLGDGELAEGSVWEAANFSSYYRLNNLIAIADINGLGQSQETMFGHDALAYANRFKAFGWETEIIDGHNFADIEKAFQNAIANKTKKPFVIVASTQKGKGVSFLEGKEGWHGKALKKDELEKALQELGEVDDEIRFTLRQPDVILNPLQADEESRSFASVQEDIHYKLGEQIATREVYGKVLAKIGERDARIVALDGDVKNSTYAMDFQKIFPDRFIECFIAEQNMVGVAVGLSQLGKKPFVSTFSAFMTRAFDQIRMAALSDANICFVGSHSGVSIGEDGSSQMGLEDMAMFGAIPNSVVLHPSDAVSTAKLLEQLATHTGISYLRTLRPKTPVLYDQNQEFQIGGSVVLKESKNDILTLIGCGITVLEALSAYEQLKKEGIFVRVVDCYSIKPIDKKTIEQCCNETMKKIIVTVEDHYSHGGLGDFVLEAVNGKAEVVKLAVTKTPRSGTKDELLYYEQIDAHSIVNKIKQLI